MELTYKQILQRSLQDGGNEMWTRATRIEALLETVSKTNPEIVNEFLLGEYVAVNGEHYIESLARMEVAKMFHLNDKNDIILGELISEEEAISYAPIEDREILRWDAYVAINSMMHDLSNTGLTREQMIDCAISFWFNDDDCLTTNKIWRFFSHN